MFGKNKNSSISLEFLWKVFKILIVIIIIIFIIIPIIISIINMFKPDDESVNTMRLIAYEVKQLKNYVIVNNLNRSGIAAPYYIKSKYMVEIKDNKLCLKDKDGEKSFGDCIDLVVACKDSILHKEENRPGTMFINVYQEKNGELYCTIDLMEEEG